MISAQERRTRTLKLIKASFEFCPFGFQRLKSGSNTPDLFVFLAIIHQRRRSVRCHTRDETYPIGAGRLS